MASGRTLQFKPFGVDDPRLPPETQTMLAVERTFRLIDEHFSHTLSNVPRNQDRQRIISVRDAARDAYWKAVEGQLGNDSTHVQRVRADLKSANLALEQSLGDPDNTVRLLQAMNQAVKLSTCLTSLAAD